MVQLAIAGGVGPVRQARPLHPPMNDAKAALPGAKARLWLWPHSTHNTPTTAMAAKLIARVLSTLRLRTNPA